MATAAFARTWWGQKFIAALEEFTDLGRLARGRSYVRNRRILTHQLDQGTVRATVRGSINPYFHVYTEPIYNTMVRLKAISRPEWTEVIADVAVKAGYIAKLLLDEMPDTIEDAFVQRNLRLLPVSKSDFTTSCSCPDWGDPCKHVAGLCYLLASELDQDPFLLFELRGLPRDQLHAELAQSPLGQILASELTPREVPLEPVQSFFTRPTKQPAGVPVSLKEFWTGRKRLPRPPEPSNGPAVPAPLVKKQGDYPPFWKKDGSFVEAMEALYQRVREKSPSLR
jgi:uncharacterized Zn finger protein